MTRVVWFILLLLLGLVFPAWSAQEVTVTYGAYTIADGDTTPRLADGTHFDWVSQNGAALARTFTVTNLGDATLTCGGVSVPAGFTVTEDVSVTIAAGTSDTFTISLATGTVGLFMGTLSFVTDDADENPYNFRIAGCVTLSTNYTSPAWTETDPGSEITVAAGVVTFAGLDRDEDARVYYDKGAGYFDEDFAHEFVVNISAFAADTCLAVVWMLSNSVDDWKGLVDASGDGVCVQAYRAAGGALSFRLVVSDDGVETTDSSVAITAGTTYYITVQRDDDGGVNGTGQYLARIKTSRHYEGTLRDTLTVDAGVGEQNNYRYVFTLNTSNAGTADKTISGTVGGLYLLDASHPFQGYGLETQGAKSDPDGWEVYHVVGLVDAPMYTPGIMQYGALRLGGQTKGQYLVFDVGGTLTLGTNYRLRDNCSFLTFDGATAPDPGITIDQALRNESGVAYSTYEFGIEPSAVDDPATDFIFYKLRILGPLYNWPWPSAASFSKDILGLNASDAPIQGVIIDHCTLIGAGDAIMDINGEVTDVSIGWNFIKDTKVATALAGDSLGYVQRVSLHHNLWTGNAERQPKIKSHSEDIDLVNNVCYGWGVDHDDWRSGKGLQIEPFDHWQHNTTYAVGEVRYYGGLFYQCLVAHTSNQAGPPHEEPDTNTTDWVQIAWVTYTDWPKVNIIGNVYRRKYGIGEVTYWGLKRYNAWEHWTAGQLYFEDNEFPAEEIADPNTNARLQEQVSSSTEHAVPAANQVTAYASNTLGTNVVPYVGTQYATVAEQALLDEIAAELGGEPPPEAPSIPTTPSPANAATNQAINPLLTWVEGATGGATEVYHLYLDTANPPTTLRTAVGGQEGTSFDASSLNLARGTTYYWKVVAENGGGDTSSTSSVWSFTTTSKKLFLRLL